MSLRLTSSVFWSSVAARNGPGVSGLKQPFSVAPKPTGREFGKSHGVSPARFSSTRHRWNESNTLWQKWGRGRFGDGVAPPTCRVCVVCATRLEIHAVTHRSVPVWGQPSTGALDVKNPEPQPRNYMRWKPVTTRPGCQGPVGQWGAQRTDVRRNRLAGPPREKLLQTPRAPAPAPDNTPHHKGTGALRRRGHSELVFRKRAFSATYRLKKFLQSSAQNFIYSKMLICPQTSCFAKYTTRLLQQGCGFRAWVLPSLLGPGTSCRVPSSVVTVHHGRRVGSLPAQAAGQALVRRVCDGGLGHGRRTGGKSGARCGARPDC